MEDAQVLDIYPRVAAMHILLLNSTYSLQPLEKQKGQAFNGCGMLMDLSITTYYVFIDPSKVGCFVKGLWTIHLFISFPTCINPRSLGTNH